MKRKENKEELKMGDTNGNKESRDTDYSGYLSQFGILSREEAEAELDFQYISDDERKDHIFHMTTKPIDLTPVRELCRAAGLKQRFDPQDLTGFKYEFWEIEKGEYHIEQRNARVELECLRETDLHFGYISYVAAFINGDLAFTDNRLSSLNSLKNSLEHAVKWVESTPDENTIRELYRIPAKPIDIDF